MMKKTVLLFIVIFILIFAVAPAVGQAQLVSGNLKKLNGNVRIAVDPAGGNGLIVWCQGDLKDNEKGKIYGAEVWRQEDGSYLTGEPFVISGSGDSNQRPALAFLPNTGKYMIAWDQSLYDPKAFIEGGGNPHPLPSSPVLARTYTPGTATVPGTMGGIVTVSDSAYEFNIVADIVLIETDGGETPAAVADRVFLTFFCSDEQKDGKDGPFAAGLWGTVWDVTVNASGPTTVSDFVPVRSKLMADWSVQYGMGMTSQGFYAGGRVYAAGAHEDFNYGGLIAAGGIYKIDPGSLTVDQFYETGATKNDDFPLTAFGQVYPLTDLPAAPAASTFRVIGISNVIFNIISINNDLVMSSSKNLGPVSGKATELVDQRFFKLSGTASAPLQPSARAKKSDLYILYHTKKGQFRYRNLSLDEGAPAGGSTTVLTIKKKRLKWMDAGTYGGDVLLAYSQQTNKKNYKIYFYKFVVD
jgi:hypothetical protein